MPPRSLVGRGGLHNSKGNKMPKRRLIYRGGRLKNTEGKPSRFRVDHAGTVYDDGGGDGTVRKVGKITKDGKLMAHRKYLAKFGDRLKDIVFSSEKQTNQGDKKHAEVRI